jgi:uncharacterized protein
VTEFAPMAGLLGGVLIGIGAVLLMATIGRIAGICGMLFSALTSFEVANAPWRLAFLVGLPVGALLVTAAGLKDWTSLSFPAGTAATVAGGLLVGFGTILGSGCTSGHGICGLARWSRRSLVATLVFMLTVAATVFVTRHLI